MVIVMSDMTFPMAVKFGVLHVLYYIKSCPTSLLTHLHITKPSDIMALTTVTYVVY
jgi:hypothetical protein